MKTKKKTGHKRCFICIMVILAVLAIGSTLFVSRKNVGIMAKRSRPTLCLDQSCMYVQVVSSDFRRTQGLASRKYLDEDKGLLLDFEESGIHSVSMRNVLIPLDIARLDEKFTILSIKTMAQSCVEDPCPSFVSSSLARYILELNGGAAEKMGYREGEVLNFQK